MNTPDFILIYGKVIQIIIEFLDVCLFRLLLEFYQIVHVD